MNSSFTQYRRLLIHYLAPHRGVVLLLAMLIVSDIGLQLAGPQVVRAFIDAAVTNTALRDLLLLAALFLGVTLLQQGIAVAAAYVGDNVAWRATNALRTDLFAHCVGLEMDFHHRYTPGMMIERIDGDVGVLNNFFSRFALLVLGNVLLVLGVLVLLYREDWRLGLLFTFFTVIALLTLRTVEGKVAPFWRAAREASAALYGFLEERLGGLDDIRANGAIPAVMRQFFQAQQAFFQKTMRARYLAQVIGSTVDLVLSVGALATLALGVYLYQRQVLTLGGVYLITQYTHLILRPLNVLARQVDDLQAAGAGVQRINELWQQQPTLVDGDQSLQVTDAATVAFDHVTFGYTQTEETAERAPVVLDNLTFTLQPGRVLGLLGRTGSGKSTLIRLLFRLYDPDQGTIRFNDQPLPDLRIADLRRHIGLVTQHVQLFDGTLRDNITFFDPAITDAQIQAAFAMLKLTPWVAQLPAGLETRLSAGGQGLSAGEAQLLAFTRVFLKNPALVILDEASSRLDPVTEHLIEGAIDQLLRGRTGIIIAHRLATVQRVDDILILQQGRILEQGERMHLAANSHSHYARLLATDLQEVLR